MRAVERNDRSRRRGVLRVQIAESLQVFREGVGSGERKALRISPLNIHLERVVPDAAHRDVLLHEAGEKPKWRLAEAVVEALVELGTVDPGTIADAPLEAAP